MRQRLRDSIRLWLLAGVCAAGCGDGDLPLEAKFQPLPAAERIPQAVDEASAPAPVKAACAECHGVMRPKVADVADALTFIDEHAKAEGFELEAGQRQPVADFLVGKGGH